MKVLLLQLDGSQPNIALMRLAAHHRDKGDAVAFRRAIKIADVERSLFDDHDACYASLIFQKTRQLAEALLVAQPDAIVGGTGWNDTDTLEAHGITTLRQDYSIYPSYPFSLGFVRRGCRLRCSFCIVPRKEGSVRNENSIASVWRGDPWPRDLILLDNDFFAPGWQPLIEDIRSGGFRVSFNQGINVRALTDEAAAAIASIDYRDDSFKRKRLYTAWDNRADEKPLFRGLGFLTKRGVKPDNIMVYVLIGYDHASRCGRPDLTPDDFRRIALLREFGARPYPMPYVRTKATVGFQRYVIGAYDKRITWSDWERAGYEPRRLGVTSPSRPESTAAIRSSSSDYP